jgi:hypothetical protein
MVAMQKEHCSPAAKAAYDPAHKPSAWGAWRSVGDEAMPEATNDFEDFFSGYITAALWSSMDDDGNSMSEGYSEDDIDAETLLTMQEDCARFMRENATDLAKMAAMTSATMGDLGYDFWLTRNGHGAGFWDRGAGEIGERLSAAACAYGCIDLYIGDDGKIYD